MRILIATDGLPHSDLAAKFTGMLAEITGAEINILTVLRRRVPPSKAQAILDHAEKLVSDGRDVEVHRQVRRGSPRREIINEAVEGDYDLLVLGWRPRGHSWLRLTEPTSKHAIQKAPCPVAIAKSDGGNLQRILVCDSGAMDPPLLDRFKEHLSPLMASEPQATVLHVMSQISAGPEIDDWQLKAKAQELIEAHTPEGEILEHDIEELEEINIHPRPKIRHGFVVDEILAEARRGNYDLVVIGAHHHAGTLDLLLDDLAQQIIDQIDRAILMVK